MKKYFSNFNYVKIGQENFYVGQELPSGRNYSSLIAIGQVIEKKTDKKTPPVEAAPKSIEIKSTKKQDGKRRNKN